MIIAKIMIKSLLILFAEFVPSKSNFGLIEYLGPSPIKDLYEYFPLPGVVDFISVNFLFAVPILHAGDLPEVSFMT